MKKFFKTFFLLIFVTTFNAQAMSSTFVRDTMFGKITTPASFRLNFSLFQYGLGPWNANTKSDLSEESSFILSTTNKLFTGFHVDLQAIFKDKTGIETGFDFFDGALNEKKIRNELPNHIPDYSIRFPKTDDDGGDSPFRGGYNYRIFKIGLVGFIRYKKAVILPYADYLYSIESNYPNVTVIFTDPLSNFSFNRVYKFYNTSCMGYKLGVSLRGYIKNKRGKVKHSGLYMQARVEFVYLKTNGYSYYSDKDGNNNEYISPSNHFTQIVSAVVFGVTLAGFDLHW